MRPILFAGLFLVLHDTAAVAETPPWFARGLTPQGRYDQCRLQMIQTGSYGDEKAIQSRCGDDPGEREIRDYYRCHGFDENGIYTGKPPPKDCS